MKPPALTLLPSPRILAVRGRPASQAAADIFTLPDYEVTALPGVHGNKARKLATVCGYEGASPLCEVPRSALPAREPSWTDDAVQHGLVSCGGPQSNAMLALARVCAARSSRLTYHTAPLPKWLKESPIGNLRKALELGSMELVEHESALEYSAAKAAAASLPNFVPTGGAWPAAEPGVAALGRHITDWRRTRPGGGLEVPKMLQSRQRGLDIVIPSGTGTTALFLARHVPAGANVYAVPCVGDGDYLLKQMRELDERSGGVGVFPRVLPPPPSHDVPFGTVAAPLLSSWRDAAQSGVFLDLVYGPVAWAAMEACGWRPGGEADGDARRDVLHINTGGHEGLHSQMQRYRRAGLLRRWDDTPTLYSLAGRYRGQWDVKDVILEASRTAARVSGLVHTRDAGL